MDVFPRALKWWLWAFSVSCSVVSPHKPGVFVELLADMDQRLQRSINQRTHLPAAACMGRLEGYAVLLRVPIFEDRMGEVSSSRTCYTNLFLRDLSFPGEITFSGL